MNRHPALVLAALAGIVHGGFSLYWAFGGTWLLATVGEVATQFAGLAWVIVLVGLAKIGFALLPLVDHKISRFLSYLGGVGLVIYGAMNTLVANLVLAGILGDGDYNATAMAGHAWLWDPLFLLWGAALLLGLWRTRPTTT